MEVDSESHWFGSALLGFESWFSDIDSAFGTLLGDITVRRKEGRNCDIQTIASASP